jgi:hypothetical protein
LWCYFRISIMTSRHILRKSSNTDGYELITETSEDIYLYFQQTVRLAKRPFGKTCVWQSVFRQNVWPPKLNELTIGICTI